MTCFAWNKTYRKLQKKNLAVYLAIVFDAYLPNPLSYKYFIFEKLSAKN